MRTDQWLPAGRGKWGGEIRVGIKEVQMTTYKVNKLQGYIIWHRGYRPYFIITK